MQEWGKNVTKSYTEKFDSRKISEVCAWRVGKFVILPASLLFISRRIERICAAVCVCVCGCARACVVLKHKLRDTNDNKIVIEFSRWLSFGTRNILRNFSRNYLKAEQKNL